MASESGDSERFSEGWEESAKKSFGLMDSKEADTIAGTELEFYFQVIGESPSRAEVKAAMTALGKSESDRFTFEECVAALKSFISSSVASHTALSASDIVGIVTQALDPSGTGSFDKEELIKLMTVSNGPNATYELLARDEMDQILAELKISENNKVLATDFFSLLLDVE